jgi:DNA (cytosine-5)-methyltransferase 1
MPPLTSIELFSGAGGLALGLCAAGFHHELLVERDRFACETLQANIDRARPGDVGDWNLWDGDIRFLDLEELDSVDLIAAGAACQPFSVAGNRGGRSDKRNLIPDFVEAVRRTAPRAFILENVEGLVTMFRPYFDYVVDQLRWPEAQRRLGEKWTSHGKRLAQLRSSSGLSYAVTWACLNAADYGVPQRRRRVFVVGYRSDVGKAFDWQNTMPPGFSKEALLYEQWVSASYWERNGLPRPTAIPERVAASLPRVRRSPVSEKLPWRTVREAISDLPDPVEAGSLQHVIRPGARCYKGHSGSDLDMPSKTIKAGRNGQPGGENVLCVGAGVRYFTIREMARLQGFPDEWSFSGHWTAITRQIGNAVPVALAELLGSRIAEDLRTAADVKEERAS